jgi:RNA polymerase sigma-70 factor (family 1)
MDNSNKYVSHPFTARESPGDRKKNVIDDQVIRKALKEGDTASFEQLYKYYGKRIHIICTKRFFLSHEDAEEVIQDTFLKIWKNRDHLDVSLSVHAYVFTVARSIILNNLRKNATAVAYKNYLILKPDNFSTDTSDHVDYMDLEKNLQKLLDDLPPQQKSIFILSKFHDLSNDEIAKKLNLSKRTVENQLYRALKIVKENLKSYKIYILLLMLSIF